MSEDMTRDELLEYFDLACANMIKGRAYNQIRTIVMEHFKEYDERIDEIVEHSMRSKEENKVNRLINLDMFDCDSAQDEQSRIEVELGEAKNE